MTNESWFTVIPLKIEEISKIKIVTLFRDVRVAYLVVEDGSGKCIKVLGLDLGKNQPGLDSEENPSIRVIDIKQSEKARVQELLEKAARDKKIPRGRIEFYL